MIYEYFDIQFFAGETTIGPDAAPVNVTGTTTNGNNTNITSGKTFWDTALLANARAALVFNQFGKKQALRSRNGKTVEWRRFKPFEKATTPLQEGVIPQGRKIDMEAITATLQQYGDYTTISDQLEWAAVDGVVGETVKEHGVQAGTTLDTLTRDVVVAGATNKVYAGNATQISGISASTKITITDIARAVRELKAFNVPTIKGNYCAIIHPDVTFDLITSDGWIDVHKYASPDEIYNGEIGKIYNVRFIESTEAPITKNGASNAAVYHCIVFGEDAWGVVEPTGMSLETIMHDKHEIGGPIDQFSTVGWKAMHVAKVLDPTRLVDLCVGSTYSGVASAN